MTKIGFVGLGMMGNPMALNLIRAGYDVMVYDVRADAATEAAGLGAEVAPDIAAMAACDPVFIIVNTGPQAEEVLDGIVSGLSGDKELLAVVMSTISPDLIKTLAKRVGEKGVRVLDAPVSGAPILAQTGGLSIMVGGAADLFESVKPHLSAMGNTIRHMGPLGMGLTMKLVNNLVGITNGYVLTEALKIGLAGGLDVKTMVEMIRASSGNNWIVENWDAYIAYLGLTAAEPRFLADFHQTATKDITTMLEWAKTLGLDTGVVESALDILDSSDAMSEEMVGKLIKG
jgi:3-hydroxyisobutyrate dehydrogenase-like beta-hydroxyacid dehydrogenase